jgi:hypothetical protein
MKALGGIPSGARRGLGLPRLMPIEGRAEGEGGGNDNRESPVFHGSPTVTGVMIPLRGFACLLPGSAR